MAADAGSVVMVAALAVPVPLHEWDVRRRRQRRHVRCFWRVVRRELSLPQAHIGRPGGAARETCAVVAVVLNAAALAMPVTRAEDTSTGGNVLDTAPLPLQQSRRRGEPRRRRHSRRRRARTRDDSGNAARRPLRHAAHSKTVSVGDSGLVKMKCDVGHKRSIRRGEEGATGGARGQHSLTGLRLDWRCLR